MTVTSTMPGSIPMTSQKHSDGAGGATAPPSLSVSASALNPHGGVDAGPEL